MKILYSLILVLTTTFSSCNKNDSINKDEFPIEVSVKVVDAMCASIIFEIQDPSLKYLGDAIFEHKGSVYRGAILIDRAHCLSDDLLKKVYDDNGVKVNSILNVKLLKNTPSSLCDKGTCKAVFGKAPSKIYYIQ